MQVGVYIINAFTKNGSGGNPAGAVLNENCLNGTLMQHTAAKVGLPETAFIQSSGDADFKIRFFTPTKEVKLCGHAVVAAFNLLLQRSIVKPGRYTIETGAGRLNADVKSDGTVFLQQNLPTFGDTADKKEIAQSLNITEEDMAPDLPAQVVSTGLRDIIVPVRNIPALMSAVPNFSAVSNVCCKYRAVGYHLFTLDTKFNSTALCRNFAPLYGIPEEAATGTACGALSCYLFKYGLISEKEIFDLKFEQGYSMGRLSEILAVLKAENKNITEVKVGGKAEVVKFKQIQL